MPAICYPQREEIHGNDWNCMRLNCLIACLFLRSASFCEADESTEPPGVDRQIAILQAVDKEGSGNERAKFAIRELEQAGSRSLLKVLEAMEEASDLGLNWLRAAADTIIDRDLAAQRPLPLIELGEFLLDSRHHPRARRYAYELIVRFAPETAARLLPGMLYDPSLELRRDAVQRLLEGASGGDSTQGTVLKTLIYRQALDAARDVDQIQSIADELRRLGQEVDFPRRFGFLMRWKVIGPFENANRMGFDRAFPPENEIDLSANYLGKEARAKWQDFVTSDEYGMVDFNRVFGPLKESVAYAYAEFESPEARPAELRLGCKNAWKIWLNGEFLFGREEYHRGMRIDQYQVKGHLRTGRNGILLKICQNEQMEDWTVQWQFQLRVCDENGTAILSQNRLPTPLPSRTKNTRSAIQ